MSVDAWLVEPQDVGVALIVQKQLHLQNLRKLGSPVSDVRIPDHRATDLEPHQGAGHVKGQAESDVALVMDAAGPTGSESRQKWSVQQSWSESMQQKSDQTSRVYSNV